MAGTVFVTVGTTKFEALIQALDSPTLAEVLVARGYTRLVLQLGTGGYVPRRLVPEGGQASGEAALGCGLHVSYFGFAPSLAQHMRAASLIISHAGSGSVFEALQLRKPLVAVPNAQLMANHQAELAEHLASLGHLFMSTPETLIAVLQRMDVSKLVPYERGDASGIVAAIDELMIKSTQASVPVLYLIIACVLAILLLIWKFAGQM